MLLQADVDYAMKGIEAAVRREQGAVLAFQATQHAWRPSPAMYFLPCIPCHVFSAMHSQPCIFCHASPGRHFLACTPSPVMHFMPNSTVLQWVTPMLEGESHALRHYARGRLPSEPEPRRIRGASPLNDDDNDEGTCWVKQRVTQSWHSSMHVCMHAGHAELAAWS